METGDRKRKIETILEEGIKEGLKRIKVEDDKIDIFYRNELREYLLFDFQDLLQCPEEAAQEIIKCLGKKRIVSIHYVLTMMIKDEVIHYATSNNILLMVKITTTEIRQQAMFRGVRASKYNTYNDNDNLLKNKDKTLKKPQDIWSTIFNSPYSSSDNSR
ncbi:hypothetical protein BDA99DRAFT_608069 [Phascolomyces articulosus]|uniref:Uncharacterized protein n=1 Tax=Phascolomyces articulosus TaxID=60185 RepID=A0AAD5JRM5_9FUNG|nr:hypothetical protein BDA99DRAFT_608069 [Phascolomyces articulosus]